MNKIIGTALIICFSLFLIGGLQSASSAAKSIPLRVIDSELNLRQIKGMRGFLIGNKTDKDKFYCFIAFVKTDGRFELAELVSYENSPVAFALQITPDAFLITPTADTKNTPPVAPFTLDRKTLDWNTREYEVKNNPSAPE